VEFFGVCLQGFVFTEYAWVQSYGSRYVRPPIIHGDVKRTAPMTVREFKVAQKLTDLPVKGMLTGPVTMLNWSFARSDVSRSTTAFQLALAIREEVADLEAAGCSIVQVRPVNVCLHRWKALLTCFFLDHGPKWHQRNADVMQGAIDLPCSHMLKILEEAFWQNILPGSCRTYIPSL
jgi:hypothetical protein